MNVTFVVDPGRKQFCTRKFLDGMLVHVIPGGACTRLGRIAHEGQFKDFGAWKAPCGIARKRNDQIIDAIFDPVDKLSRSPTAAHGRKNLALQPITRFARNLFTPGNDDIDRSHRLRIPDMVEFESHLLRRRGSSQNSCHRSTHQQAR